MISICSLWIGTAAVNSHYFSGGADPPGRPCHFNCISVEEVTGGTEGRGVKQRSSVPHNKNGCQCSRKKKATASLEFFQTSEANASIFLLIPEEFFFFFIISPVPRQMLDPAGTLRPVRPLHRVSFFCLKKSPALGDV